MEFVCLTPSLLSIPVTNHPSRRAVGPAGRYVDPQFVRAWVSLLTSYRHGLTNNADHLFRARMGISLVFVGVCGEALLQNS
jgi:hypothetical protein